MMLYNILDLTAIKVGEAITDTKTYKTFNILKAVLKFGQKFSFVSSFVQKF